MENIELSHINKFEASKKIGFALVGDFYKLCYEFSAFDPDEENDSAQASDEELKESLLSGKFQKLLNELISINKKYSETILKKFSPKDASKLEEELVKNSLKLGDGSQRASYAIHCQGILRDAEETHDNFDDSWRGLRIIIERILKILPEQKEILENEYSCLKKRASLFQIPFSFSITFLESSLNSHFSKYMLKEVKKKDEGSDPIGFEDFLDSQAQDSEKEPDKVKKNSSIHNLSPLRKLLYIRFLQDAGKFPEQKEGQTDIEFFKHLIGPLTGLTYDDFKKNWKRSDSIFKGESTEGQAFYRIEDLKCVRSNVEKIGLKKAVTAITEKIEKISRENGKS